MLNDDSSAHGNFVMVPRSFLGLRVPISEHAEKIGRPGLDKSFGLKLQQPVMRASCPGIAGYYNFQ
jgi:hypothetical protein